MNEPSPRAPVERIVGRLESDEDILRDVYMTRAQRDACERILADAKRARYMLENAEWFRFDQRTHLAVLVPAGSILDSYGTRERAIDDAMGKQPNA